MAPFITAVFITGFSSVIFQVVFLREFITIFYGNEICIGAVIGFWLLGVSAGALLGAKVSACSKNIERYFVLSFLALNLFFTVLLFLLRVSAGVFSAQAGEYIPFYKTIVMALLFVFPVSFQTGFTFPIACGVIKEHYRVYSPAGKIYIAESAGSLFGGALFTFILINTFDYFQISTIQIVGSVITVLFITVKRKLVRAIVCCFVLAMGIFLFIYEIPSKINDFTIEKRWSIFFRQFPLKKSIDTKYQNVTLSCQNEQADIYNNLKYAASIPPSPYTSGILAMFTLSQSLNPKNILIIEGVFSGLIAPILSCNPELVDVLVIDRAYFNAVEQFLPDSFTASLYNPKVKIRFADGRFFIKNSKSIYDIIFVNISDPETAMANRFYTYEFFQEAKQTLSKNGIIVIKLASSQNYIGDDVLRYNASIYKTMKKVFKNLLVTYGDTKYFFACQSDGILTENPSHLIERYKSMNIKNGNFAPEIFFSMLEKEKMEFTRSKLESGLNLARVNTDSNPIAYHYNLYLWDTFSGSKLSWFLRKIERLSAFYFAVFMFCFTLIAFIACKLFIKNGLGSKIIKPVLFWTTLSTGFSAMAVEILLLFVFQNIFGYLYYMIGFIVAVFMCGLTVGAFLSDKIINKGKPMRFIFRAMVIVELLIPVLGFSLPFAINFLNSIKSIFIINALFFPMPLLCGFLTGFEFPLSVCLFSAADDNVIKSSGLLDCADHLGSFFGAVLAGTFLLPLLGFSSTAVIVGVMNLSSCVLVLLCGASVFGLKK